MGASYFQEVVNHLPELNDSIDGKGRCVFDYYLLPVCQKDNLEQADLPGLLITKAPKRADRTKTEDVFVALLAGKAGSPPDMVAAEDLKYLLQKTAEVYFSASGTMTAGMKKAVDQLNDQLVTFNLRTSKPVWLVLNLAVLRKDTLYIVNVGAAQTCVVNKEQVNIFSGTQAMGEGKTLDNTLGTEGEINLRFYQTEVTAGTLLIMTPALGDSWTAEMKAAQPQLSLESQRRRLLHHAPANYQGLIWQLKPGNGAIHLLRRRGIGAADVTPAPTMEKTQMVEAQPVRREERPLPVQPGAEETVATEPTVRRQSQGSGRQLDQGIYLSGERVEPAQDAPVKAAPPAQTNRRAVDIERVPTEKEEVLRKPVRQEPAREQRNPAVEQESKPLIILPSVDQAALKSGVVGFLGMLQKIRYGIVSTVQKVLSSLLPGTGERVLGIPPSALLFIAVAIPLVVVAVSMTVYLKRGVSVEQTQLLQEAAETVVLAQAEDDKGVQRIYWEKVLELLDKADVYGETEKSLGLRDDALTAIDEMDGVGRVEVSLIANGAVLGENTSINRIIASDTEFYLLDHSQGRIMRMYLAGDKYQMDETFECGTGTYSKMKCEEKNDVVTCKVDPESEGLMGPPVDMVMLPINNLPQSTILAIDGEGDLMYCDPGSAPMVDSLPLPARGWIQITTISLSDDILYVTDKGNNMVYYAVGNDAYFPPITKGSNNNSVSNLTAYFSGAYVPRFDQVLDMKMNNGEMFLLKNDGTMISCLEMSTLECSDPAPYHDIRQGSNTEPIPLELDGEVFTQMQITQPSMPAIFLLEASRQTVYQFSWKLNLVRQLKPRGNAGIDLPDTAPTALAITPNHIMIIAYDNRIYAGSLP